MKSGSPVDVSAVIDRSPLSRVQTRAIALCVVIGILDGFDAQAIGFVAPAVARDWGIPVAEFGPVFSAGLIGMMVGGMVFGPLADRVGRRRIILVCTVVFGVLSLAQAFATSLDTLLALRFLCGLGLGGITPNLIALAAEYAPARRRSTIVTIVVAAFSLGGFLGGFLAAYLIPTLGWRAVFVVCGALPLLLLLVAWPGLPESIRFLTVTGQRRQAATILHRIAPDAGLTEHTTFVVPESTMSRSPIRALFVDGRAVNTSLLWVVFFMTLLVIYFLLTWMPSLFIQAGLTASLALVATALYNLGGMAGGIFIGTLTDRRRTPFAVLATAYLVAVVFIGVTALVAGNVVLMLVAVFVVGVGVSGSQTGISALAAEVYPTTARATGVGWAYSVGRIGSIIGPVVGGILLTSGLAAISIFSLTIVPTLLAAVGILALAWRARVRPDAMAAGPARSIEDEQAARR